MFRQIGSMASSRNAQLTRDSTLPRIAWRGIRP